MPSLEDILELAGHGRRAYDQYLDALGLNNTTGALGQYEQLRLQAQRAIGLGSVVDDYKRQVLNAQQIALENKSLVDLKREQINAQIAMNAAREISDYKRRHLDAQEFRAASHAVLEHKRQLLDAEIARTINDDWRRQLHAEHLAMANSVLIDQKRQFLDDTLLRTNNRATDEYWRQYLHTENIATASSAFLDYKRQHLATGMFDNSAIENARTMAERAQYLGLPDALSAHRTSIDSFAAKLMIAQGHGWWHEEKHLAAFGRVSAMSDMIGDSTRFSAELYEAARAFTSSAMPELQHLSDHRQFLDAAGLVLPRIPKLRLLSAAEKRRRFKAKLGQNTEQPHVRKAKSLVHRYERVLIEILDGAMASAFGDNWALTRLPLCDCNDLLGRWKKRGGEVLEHADFAHYAKIMSHKEHFEKVFAIGFDSPATLFDLMKKAGSLRAKSHHPRAFTPMDLRDLRLAWTLIETGLLALTPDYDFEFN